MTAPAQINGSTPLEFHAKHQKSHPVYLLEKLRLKSSSSTAAATIHCCRDRETRLSLLEERKRPGKNNAIISQSSTAFRALNKLNRRRQHREKLLARIHHTTHDIAGERQIARVCTNLCLKLPISDDPILRGILDVLFQSLWMDWSASSNSKKASTWRVAQQHLLKKQLASTKYLGIWEEQQNEIESAVRRFRSTTKISRRKRRILMNAAAGRRPESPDTANQAAVVDKISLASAVVNDNKDARSDAARYPTSARQRFVRSYDRPWFWGHPIAGLSSLPVPLTDAASEICSDKDIVRVIRWRRYCQRQLEMRAISSPPPFDVAAEFSNLHAFREHGRRMAQSKIKDLIHDRSAFLHFCRSENSMRRQAAHKLDVYRFAMRHWQLTFRATLFRQWKDRVGTSKNYRRALHFHENWERRKVKRKKLRQIFIRWRRSTHLARQLTVRERYMRTVERQRTVEIEIEEMERRIEETKLEIRKHEENESRVQAKEKALKVVLEGRFDLTALEATQQARAVASMAASVAKAAAERAFCDCLEFNRVWSSIVALHRGMRSFVEVLIEKLRIEKRENEHLFQRLTNEVCDKIRKFASDLRRVFDHYARSDMERPGDAAHITTTGMMSLIHDSTLDGTPSSFEFDLSPTKRPFLKKSNIDSSSMTGIVQLCLQQALKDTRRLSRRIVMPTFILFLLRVAHVKYQTVGLAEGFRHLITQDVIPHSKSFRPEMFRSTFFGSPSILRTLTRHKIDIDRVFAFYSGMSASKTMKFAQFHKFVKDACRPLLKHDRRATSTIVEKNAIGPAVSRRDMRSQRMAEVAAGKVSRTSLPNEDSPGHVHRNITLKTLVRSGYCGVLFSNVQHTPVVLSGNDSPHMAKAVGKQIRENNRMSYVEFLESIGTIAHLLYPNPYHVLAKKVSKFMENGLLKGCQMADTDKIPKYVVGDVFARVSCREAEHEVSLKRFEIATTHNSIRDLRIAATGVLSHADFSGNGVRSMLLHDGKRSRVRGRSVIGTRVDLRSGRHKALLSGGM